MVESSIPRLPEAISQEADAGDGVVCRVEQHDSIESVAAVHKVIDGAWLHAAEDGIQRAASNLYSIPCTSLTLPLTYARSFNRPDLQYSPVLLRTLVSFIGARHTAAQNGVKHLPRATTQGA